MTRTEVLTEVADYLDDLNRNCHETGKFGAGIRAALDQAAMHIRADEIRTEKEPIMDSNNVDLNCLSTLPCTAVNACVECRTGE